MKSFQHVCLKLSLLIHRERQTDRDMGMQRLGSRKGSQASERDMGLAGGGAQGSRPEADADVLPTWPSDSLEGRTGAWSSPAAVTLRDWTLFQHCGSSGWPAGCSRSRRPGRAPTALALVPVRCTDRSLLWAAS